MQPAPPPGPRWKVDPILALAAVAGGAALWALAPLMLDQFVLFADQEQSRQAAVSREAMRPPAALVLAAAGVLLIRRRPWQALFAGLPALVAVPLAWLLPDALYQLLAFWITAPVSLGSLLAAAVPLPDRLPLPVLVTGLVLIAGLTVLTTPFLALMAFLGLFVWWRMPARGAPSFWRPGWR